MSSDMAERRIKDRIKAWIAPLIVFLGCLTICIVCLSVHHIHVNVISQKGGIDGISSNLAQCPLGLKNDLNRVWSENKEKDTVASQNTF